MKRLSISLLVSVVIFACGIRYTLPTQTTMPIPATKQTEKLPQSAPVANPMTGLVIAETALTIRKLPTEQSPSIGFLKPGALVILTGNLDLKPGSPECPGGWWQIDGGYICADYIEDKQ